MSMVFCDDRLFFDLPAPLEIYPVKHKATVWCVQCGRDEKVDPNHCLQHGWPECCGYTMTIDNPAERIPR